MDWETFHRKWIKQFKPDCHGCGDTLYPSEGFAVKVKGQIVGYCSHGCRDNTLYPDDEDSDWGCWVMHAPEAWLED